MRRWVSIGLAIPVSLLLFGVMAASARQRSTGFTVDDADRATDCSQTHFNFDDYETVRGEKRLTIPKPEAPLLVVRAAKNGGIRVVGWSGNEYSVTACTAAAGEDRDSAQKALDQIALSFHSGRLSVDGPGDERWTAYLIIRAPRDSAMDLEAFNGPISLREYSGKIKVRSTNGPIAFKRCSGDIEAYAKNGPIDLSGDGGNFRLQTENGPISVELNDTHWKNGALDAHSENGPLSLKLPRGYQSGIRMETSWHSPMRCEAAGCDEAQKTWDDEHRFLVFGKLSPVVRLSTINGPVSVESGGGEL
jgi:hypothetical protein